VKEARPRLPRPCRNSATGSQTQSTAGRPEASLRCPAWQCRTYVHQFSVAVILHTSKTSRRSGSEISTLLGDCLPCALSRPRGDGDLSQGLALTFSSRQRFAVFRRYAPSFPALRGVRRFVVSSPSADCAHLREAPGESETLWRLVHHCIIHDGRLRHWSAWTAVPSAKGMPPRPVRRDAALGSGSFHQ